MTDGCHDTTDDATLHPSYVKLKLVGICDIYVD
jgi:hypothetical protein